MKRSRLQMLIFLGLVCAGFSYDFENPLKELAMPAVYTLLAWLTIRFKRPDQSRLPQVEGLLLFFSIPASYYLSHHLGWGPHPLIFVANALCIYQLFRLFYPMNDRERRYAFVVAIIHLSVGTFVIVDWKFIVILLLAIYLIPSALREIEGAGFPPPVEGRRVRRWPKFAQAAATCFIMVIFFLAFPRSGRWSPYIRAPIGSMRPPTTRSDLREDAEASTNHLIFKIEGEDIGYLRTYALDTFNGQVWSLSNWGKVQDSSRNLWGAVTPATRRRTVTVVDHRPLGGFFPVDGYPVRIDAPTFERIIVASHGGVLTRGTHHRPFTYRFWARKAPVQIKPLDPRRRAKYTELGFTPSAALQQWLNGVVGNETDSYEIARLLEDRFQQDDFHYQPRAPKLDDKVPIEDFVLNEKRGHCVRYAGVLTALLRMKAIPSRMVVGYVPQEYNQLGGFYNIRASHAHAWTEAWLPKKGWVKFDATPFGHSQQVVRSELVATILDWVEYVWYSKVVEFDSQEQSDLKDSVSSLMFRGLALFRSVRVLILLIPIVTAIVIVLRFVLALVRRRPRRHTREYHVREANHFYARMLAVLAKCDLFRRPGQTPLEFLHEVARISPTMHEPVARITKIFCDIRYGESSFSEGIRVEVGRELETIARLVKKR